MKMYSRYFSLIIFLLLISTQLWGKQIPPALFIDKGACPFECCQYGKWRARSKVSLYKTSDTSSKLVDTIFQNEIVNAITGEVHTIPGKVVTSVKTEWSDHSKGTLYFEKGDVLYIYTYCGEGIYKIWHNGIFIESYPPKEKWIIKPKSTWWIKIRRKNGVTGWTNRGDQFDGTDGCDQPIPPIE